MKKLSALVLALIMTFSVNAFAETGTISGSINVNGVDYKSGDAYTSRVQEHTFTKDFTVNGQKFPAGTKWEAVQMPDGNWVPLGDKPAGGIAAGGAAAGGAGAGAGAGAEATEISTMAIVIGVAVAAIAIAAASTSTTTHAP